LLDSLELSELEELVEMLEELILEELD